VRPSHCPGFPGESEKTRLKTQTGAKTEKQWIIGMTAGYCEAFFSAAAMSGRKD
jgi:hypothetical protein